MGQEFGSCWALWFWISPARRLYSDAGHGYSHLKACLYWMSERGWDPVCKYEDWFPIAVLNNSTMVAGKKATMFADIDVGVDVLVGIQGNWFLIASTFFPVKWEARLSAEDNGGRKGIGNLTREYKMVKTVYGLHDYKSVWTMDMLYE